MKIINKKFIQDFSLYLIVGGVATITEWVLFYILNSNLNLHYIIATTIAYILSTLVNLVAGRILVFKDTKISLTNEVLAIYMVSILGLLMNILIMWFLVSIFSFKEMLSKVFATGIVFAWNFIIRKLIIYK